MHLVISILVPTSGTHSTAQRDAATVLLGNSHVAPQTRHLHYEVSCKITQILLATSFLNFHYSTPASLHFLTPTPSVSRITRTTFPTITIIVCSVYDVCFHNRPDLASLADSCFLRYVTPADTPFPHAQRHCTQFHKLKRSNPSGHYMYRTVVTICTASLTFTNSTFSPHSCIYVFFVDLRTNSDYFPTQH